MKDCDFCGGKAPHNAACATTSQVNGKRYIEGFKDGLAEPQMIRSSHPAYFFGWCRALKALAKEEQKQQRTHKKP